jgi:hypothetical protein
MKGYRGFVRKWSLFGSNEELSCTNEDLLGTQMDIDAVLNEGKPSVDGK